MKTTEHIDAILHSVQELIWEIDDASIDATEIDAARESIMDRLIEYMRGN